MRAEISVLVKDTPEGSLAPSVTWGLSVNLPQTLNLPAPRAQSSGLQNSEKCISVGVC